MQKSFVYLCKGKNCFVTIKKTMFLPLPKQPLYSSIGHNPPMQLSQILFKKQPFHRSFLTFTTSLVIFPIKFSVISPVCCYLCGIKSKRN